jgi:hypothetical protein
MGMRASVTRLATFLAVSAFVCDAAAAPLPCGGEQRELAPSVLEHLVKMDEVILSLQQLLANARTARADVDQAIARGNSEPVMLEHQHVFAAREREIVHQIREFETLKERLCDAVLPITPNQQKQ